MSRAAEILPALRVWHDRQQALRQQLDAACALLGCALDGPLWQAVIEVSIDHTAAVARIVGDEGSWMEYWLYECKAGKQPREVLWPVNGRTLLLDSLEALAEVICDG